MVQRSPRFLFLFALSAGVLMAQRVECLVRDSVTSAPIRKALVSVWMQKAGRSNEIAVLTTGADGKAVYSGPAGAELTFAAEKPLYFSKGASRGRAAVVEGETKSLELRLTPTAILAGKVVDEDGDPVPDVQVSLLDRRYFEGSETYQQVLDTRTNDRGEFRLIGAGPGPHLLVSYAPNKHSGGPPKQSPPNFYPGSNEAARAQRLRTAPGTVTENLTIVQRAVAGFRLSGAVVDARSRAPFPSVSLLLATAIPGFTVPPAEMDHSNGIFVFQDVPAGSATLIARANIRGHEFFASRALDVRGDMESLTLEMMEAQSLRLQLHLEQGTMPGRVSVQMYEAATRNRRTGPPFNAEGVTVINGVIPGLYNLELTATGQGAYLKAVKYGDQLGGPKGIEINSTGPALEITLAVQGAAAVEGVASGDDGKPLPGSIVVLIPDETTPMRRSQYRHTVAGEGGKFKISNIAPGKYTAVAWQEIDDGAWLDPAVAEAALTSGEAISLAISESKSIAVRAIAADAP